MYLAKYWPFYVTITAWKVSLFGVFLVRTFPHSDCIRRDTPYLSILGPNARIYEPEKLRMRTLFTQWIKLALSFYDQGPHSSVILMNSWYFNIAYNLFSWYFIHSLNLPLIKNKANSRKRYISIHEHLSDSTNGLILSKNVLTCAQCNRFLEK